jgi:hypothetical protein
MDPPEDLEIYQIRRASESPEMLSLTMGFSQGLWKLAGISESRPRPKTPKDFAGVDLWGF